MAKTRLKVLILTEDPNCAKQLDVLKDKYGYSITVVSSFRTAESNVDFDPRYECVIIDLPVADVLNVRSCQFMRKRLADDSLMYITVRNLEGPYASTALSSCQMVPLQASVSNVENLHAELSLKPPSNRAFSYDVNIINCFIRATSEVIEYYTGEKPKLEKPRLKQEKQAAKGFVTGLTTIKGTTLFGSTSLTCDKNFVNFLATRVIGVSRSRARKDTKIISQVTKEMCDQIFGKAQRFLQELGYEFEITLPVVALSSDPPICHTAVNPVMTIPFYMSKKTFCIEFCLEFCMDQAAS